jgi:serine/threonine-protein phosphatase 2A activator
MDRWALSKTLDEVLGFVMTCNNAVIGKKLKDSGALSTAAAALVGILDKVADVVKQVPAETVGTSRFGNAAFRTFYAKVKENSREWHTSIPGLKELQGEGDRKEGDGTDAIAEVEVYFFESFGNEKRIDYGSGMELNFVCWLMCLVKLGILDISQEAPAIVLSIFWRYIEVMRLIQSTYWLEPAGSHGVWGLDDYHFLPFVFGSAQLVSHPIFRPKTIHDEEMLNDYSTDYMYFACIRFINGIKTASLWWHSPMLDDISSVKSWAKVNEGMLKMYKAEVLLKLPIAQHIYFGSLLTFPEGDDDQDESELQRAVEEGGIVHTDELGRTHVHTADSGGSGAAQAASGWGDCCGIPVPSAFGAAKEERERKLGVGGIRFSGSGTGVRRIPFD